MNALPFYVALGIGCLASGACLGQVPVDISTCASVADDKSRLKCYDEHMARSGHRVAAPAASAKTPAPAQPPAAAPKSAAGAPAASPSLPPQRTASVGSSPDEFGLDDEALRKKREADTPKPARPEELVGRVKAVSTRARGEHLIEMENGQVWVETLRTGGLPPEPGETVTIKHGTLGSFYLARRAGVALRVKRLK